MPYKSGKRKKRRTHVVLPDSAPLEKVPRSFVLRHGKVDKTARELIEDLRHVMMPHTAAKLRVRKSNTLKDFVSVAGPMGVTHMMLLSQTDGGNLNLRVGRLPRGPTITFRVERYSLARQIRAAQKRPVDVATAFRNPPLVMMTNFANIPGGDAVPGVAGVSLSDAMRMVQVTVQAMFPAINPATVKLSDCRRVLLVHYNKGTKQIELRHFVIRATPVGVSRVVKKLVQAKLPDLHKLQDVADLFVSGGSGGGAGAASDSEYEADESSRVTLPQDYHGKGNTKSQTSAIKLAEIGPRISLSLLKIEEGLCAGEVLWHAFVKKSNAEAAELKKRAADKERLKAERKAVQEANVARKAADTAAKKAAKAERKAERQAAAAEAAKEGRLGEEEEEEEEGGDAEDSDSASGSDSGGEDADEESAEEDAVMDVGDEDDEEVEEQSGNSGSDDDEGAEASVGDDINEDAEMSGGEEEGEQSENGSDSEEEDEEDEEEEDAGAAAAATTAHAGSKRKREKSTSNAATADGSAAAAPAPAFTGRGEGGSKRTLSLSVGRGGAAAAAMRAGSGGAGKSRR